MGLIASVYRDADPTWPDCTGGGLSGRHHRVCIVNANGPFDPTDDMPAVMIVKGNLGATVKAVPAHQVDGRWVPFEPEGHVGPMFGGNYLATSDSRFGELVRRTAGTDFYGAVAIHDRFETPEQYALLST